MLDVATRVFAAQRKGMMVHIRTQHMLSNSYMGVIMQAMPIDHFVLPVSLPPRKISASAFVVVN
jgi:hypothetical protein